jgi:cobalt-zinc-cadmium efflux system protein
MTEAQLRDHHAIKRGGEKNIAFAFFLNFSFTIIEIVGGLYTNSIAVLSDALHDMGDSLSLGLAWYFQKLAQKGSSKEFSFGYSRFNTLGAFINALVLVVGSIIILSEAIPRLWSTPQPDAKGMMIMAALGILVNGLAVWRLKLGAKSLNEEILTWHLLEDVFGWVAVLIGSIFMNFYDVPILDPLLSIGITLLVLFNVIKKLIRAVKIFLQATPEDIKPEEIAKKLELIEGVNHARHAHVWTLDGMYHILTIHIKTDGDKKVNELKPIKDKVRNALAELGIEHATIEFESIQDPLDTYPIEF